MSFLTKIKSWHNQKGDTLVEVLVSVAVLAAVLGVAFALSSRSLHNGVEAQNRQKALAIAQGQVSQLINAQNNLSTGTTVYQQSSAFCIDPNTGAPQTNLNNCVSYAGSNNSSTAYQTQITYTPDGTYQVQVVWDQGSTHNGNRVTLFYRPSDQFLGQTDMCPNMKGIQTVVPNGYHLDSNGNCVDSNGNPPPGGNPPPPSTSQLPICHIWSYSADGNSAFGDCAYGASTQPNIHQHKLPDGCVYYTITDYNDDGTGSDAGSPNPSLCSSADLAGASDDPTTVPGNPCPEGQFGQYVNGVLTCNPVVPGSNGCKITETGTPPNCQPISTEVSGQPSNTANPTGANTGCDLDGWLGQFCADQTQNNGSGSSTDPNGYVSHDCSSLNNANNNTVGVWNGFECIAVPASGCGLNNLLPFLPDFGIILPWHFGLLPSQC